MDQMMMTISRMPDYYLMKNLAEEILMSIEDPVLPIKVKPLIDVLIKKDLIVHTYNQYTELENVDHGGFLLSVHSKDGALRYFPDEGSYVLLYNKNMQKERKTWTIAHELGHYYAKHHMKMIDYLKDNEKIPDELNTIFEQEANCFARSLLAPTSLIQVAMALLNVKDFVSIYTIVRSLFRLSQEASYYISTDMTRLRFPNYSESLCLKYESAINNFFSIIENRNYFYVLTLKYQREIDSMDYYKRTKIRGISF